ncbi:hypothetical protein HanRHA438_Chr05g0218751 [Helianthus annuus]|nr:hypothetical protein HanHA300_Chr05g0171411 [Helianthus annuus]KAJ0584187.1 hypothetical protein HanHA89_Chr05g0185661 [Helianthus annuus]KAJ0918508.1 hypothetical protein HanRHA438_Chr05g0218751 [Helianthus annuus]
MSKCYQRSGSIPFRCSFLNSYTYPQTPTICFSFHLQREELREKKCVRERRVGGGRRDEREDRGGTWN